MRYRLEVEGIGFIPLHINIVGPNPTTATDNSRLVFRDITQPGRVLTLEVRSRWIVASYPDNTEAIKLAKLVRLKIVNNGKNKSYLGG